MAPVRTQNDQCKASAILSSTKRLLHIGKRVSGWLEQTAVRVRLGSSGTTSNEAQAYYECDYT